MEVYSSKSPWLEPNLKLFNLFLDNFNHRIVKYSENEIVFMTDEINDKVYFVKSGRVRLELNFIDGNTFHLFIVKPKNIFGESWLLTEQHNLYDAVSIVDSELYEFDFNTNIDIATYLEITENINKSINYKFNVLIDVIKNLISNDANIRVISQLINLMNAHGEIVGDKIKINIRFTHEDIASITALSRVSVSYVLGDLSRKGIIAKKKGFTYILDKNRLFDIYKGDL